MESPSKIIVSAYGPGVYLLDGATSLFLNGLGNTGFLPGNIKCEIRAILCGTALPQLSPGDAAAVDSFCDRPPPVCGRPTLNNSLRRKVSWLMSILAGLGPLAKLSPEQRLIAASQIFTAIAPDFERGVDNAYRYDWGKGFTSILTEFTNDILTGAHERKEHWKDHWGAEMTEQDKIKSTILYLLDNFLGDHYQYLPRFVLHYLIAWRKEMVEQWSHN